MIQSKMIENEEEIHCSLKHKLPILMVVCDTKIKRNQRLLCAECMENFESKAQLMSFKKVLQNIQENQKQKKESVENVIMISIKLIEELQKELFQLKSNAVQQLDQLIGNVDEWIKHVLIFGQQNVTYSFYDELDNLINKTKLDEFNQKSLIDQINQINQSWNQKLEKKLNLFKSFQEGQKCEDILKKLRKINETNENTRESETQKQVIQVDNKQKQFEQQLMMYKQVEFKLIDDSNLQKLWCYAIVFNKDGSIMISSECNKIKIWNFEQGRFKLSNSYNKHCNPVYCLVYSKKTNNFISGCTYNQIICWQQINENQWQCSQPFKQHNNIVNCLMLNKQEDQLISGGMDYKIIVWQVDFMKNDLTFLYSLDKHSNSVQSFSFNQSETVLVSCGYDHFIIWEKGQQGKWEFKYMVEQIKQLYLFTNCYQFKYHKILICLQIYNQFHISISLSINKMFQVEGKFISLMINNFFGLLEISKLMIFWYLNQRMESLNRIQIKLSLQLRMMNVKIIYYFQQFIIKIEM